MKEMCRGTNPNQLLGISGPVSGTICETFFLADPFTGRFSGPFAGQFSNFVTQIDVVIFVRSNSVIFEEYWMWKLIDDVQRAKQVAGLVGFVGITDELGV